MTWQEEFHKAAYSAAFGEDMPEGWEVSFSFSAYHRPGCDCCGDNNDVEMDVWAKPKGSVGSSKFKTFTNYEINTFFGMVLGE